MDIDKHIHCNFCIKIGCNYTICQTIYCNRLCGCNFHSCKYEEHELLCSLKRVPCINSLYGCPKFFLRKNLSKHLETCPASVVLCTMQWNRWTVRPIKNDSHKGKRSPPAPLASARYSQLDLAFAMRDQKVLYQSYKNFKESKSNNILYNKKKFPSRFIYIGHNHSLPINDKCPSTYSNDEIPNILNYNDDVKRSTSVETSTSNDSETPWESAKNPPGLQKSICEKLFIKKSHSEKIKKVNYIIEDQNFSASQSTNENLIIHSQNISSDLTNMGPNLKVNNDCTNNNMKLNQKDNEIKYLSNEYINISGQNECYEDVFLSLRHHCLTKDHPQVISNASPKTSDKVICPSSLYDLLSINMDVLPNSEHKSKLLYTFLCAEPLRRDQFASHFNDIHNTIHAGVDGWIERRCPHAENGCTFSTKRLNPKNSTLIFDAENYCFSILPNNQENKNYDNLCVNNKIHITSSRNYETKLQIDNDISELNEGNFDSNICCDIHNKENYTEQADFNILNDLPVEVLRKLLGFIDSLSLNNLSLVSKSMRHACCCILQNRGIVVQEWKKIFTNNKYSWIVSHYRWIFTNHFKPIESWIFENENEYRKHIQECVFNERISYTSQKVPMCGMVFNVEEFNKCIKGATLII